MDFEVGLWISLLLSPIKKKKKKKKTNEKNLRLPLRGLKDIPVVAKCLSNHRYAPLGQ